MSRNRNSGGGRSGGSPSGGPATPPPTGGQAPTATPVPPAAATPPTPTPAPAAPTPPNPPVGEPEELRSFEEGGDWLFPSKYLLGAAITFAAAGLIYGLSLLPWGKWGEGTAVVLGAVWLGLLGWCIYKKDSRGWALVALAVFAWLITLPAKPADTRPTQERSAWSEPVEVELPAYGETDWTDFPLEARDFQFDAGSHGFSLLCLGGKQGWMNFAPDEHTTLGSGCLTHSMKFRRHPATTSGRVVVKVSYRRR